VGDSSAMAFAAVSVCIFVSGGVCLVVLDVVSRLGRLCCFWFFLFVVFCCCARVCMG